MEDTGINYLIMSHCYVFVKPYFKNRYHIHFHSLMITLYALLQVSEILCLSASSRFV